MEKNSGTEGRSNGADYVFASFFLEYIGVLHAVIFGERWGYSSLGLFWVNVRDRLYAVHRTRGDLLLVSVPGSTNAALRSSLRFLHVDAARGYYQRGHREPCHCSLRPPYHHHHHCSILELVRLQQIGIDMQRDLGDGVERLSGARWMMKDGRYGAVVI